MCGIAGIIHRDGPSDMGVEITKMLQSMKHRGPDSTGYALYSEPDDLVTIRFMLAEPKEYGGFGIDERLERGRAEVESRLAKIGADLATIHSDTGYAFRATVRYDGDLKPLADYLEDIPGCKVLSLGNSLEIIKDLGDAITVQEQYSLAGIRGTHGIGHVRMATESDVDLASAHPYWAYPFADVAVVHNGQLTNYHKMKRLYEQDGYRFQTHHDSELIAVYLAHHLERDADLKRTLHRALEDLDGTFTFLVSTPTGLGCAKDKWSAKPLVIMERHDVVAVASEEVALRQVFPEEIERFEPQENEVITWST